MINHVRHFEHVMPEYNTSIAFIDEEDPTRWVIGWMDVAAVREEGGQSHEPADLTLWFELPPVNLR